jgi:hypothetical protein
VIHLGSLCGVKITDITPSSVTAKAVPTFVFRPYGLDAEVSLQLGERATIGPYSVTLQGIDGPTAKLSVCTANYAWEQALLAYIQPMIGQITLSDMMGWSRLHSADLDGLRPMCEDANTDEAALVCRVPHDYASLLSSGWFAANHPCASIYVPVHICDDDVYDPYETGEAAALSLNLLHKYGHGTLTSTCQGIESVFILENEVNEFIASIMIQNGLNITPFLTMMDTGMQEQAFLTEQLWQSIPNATQGIIKDIWEQDYVTSLSNMGKAVGALQENTGSAESIALLEAIALSIGKSWMNAANVRGVSCPSAQQDFTKAQFLFSIGEHARGFLFLQQGFHGL